MNMNKPGYELYPDASHIPYDKWAADGVKGLMLDKDGTITEVNKPTPVDRVMQAMLEHDVANLFEGLAIVSNNHNPAHVEQLAKVMEAELGIGVLAISRAEGFRRKPYEDMGIEVARRIGLEPQDFGVIGDRRGTDVVFGRRLGAAKIALCQRLGTADAGLVPVVRRIEDIWVARDLKRGLATNPDRLAA